MPSVVRAVGMRLLYGIPVIIVVTLGAAVLADLMPGSPAQAILGDQATADQIQALNQQYGYNDPVLERYLAWVGNALRGDFGVTMFGNEPVLDLLLRRLAVTGELTLLALGMSLLVAVPLASWAALRQRGIADRVLHLFSSALLSLPSFVTVVVLSLVVSGWLGAAPATGWAPIGDGLFRNLQYAVLPAMSMALYEAAFFYRVLRGDLARTLREDFVLVARAKGFGRPYILARHLLRPSLSSLVTVVGLSLGRLLGGSVIAESFFAVPGLGAEALSAVSVKDMGVLQAIVTLAVVVYVVIFILVDLAYAWIDPRVSVR